MNPLCYLYMYIKVCGGDGWYTWAAHPAWGYVYMYVYMYIYCDMKLSMVIYDMILIDLWWIIVKHGNIQYMVTYIL